MAPVFDEWLGGEVEVEVGLPLRLDDVELGDVELVCDVAAVLEDEMDAELSGVSNGDDVNFGLSISKCNIFTANVNGRDIIPGPRGLHIAISSGITPPLLSSERLQRTYSEIVEGPLRYRRPRRNVKAQPDMIIKELLFFKTSGIVTDSRSDSGNIYTISPPSCPAIRDAKHGHLWRESDEGNVLQP